MQLNIYNAKNLNHCLQTIKLPLKKSSQNGKVLIFVPDKLSLEMEKNIFEILNTDCTFNVEVITINRFCKSIIAGHVPINYINSIGSTLLVQKVLKNNKDKFVCFKAGDFSYQYCSEIFKTLAQLKACQANHETLKSYKSQNIWVDSKVNDLGRLLELYNIEKADMLDANDIITQSLFYIKQENLINTSCFFVGFDDFTFQGYSLIEQLLINCKEVNVFCYANKSADNAHIFPAEVQDRLIEKCRQLAIPYEIIESEYNSGKLKNFLSDNLFGLKKLSFNMDKQNSVLLINAQSFEDETEFAARNIREKILHGHSYNEFGVLVFGLNERAETIRNIFDKYDILYYIDKSYPIINTPYYKFLSNIISLVLNDCANDDIIEFINSPFTDLEKLKLTNEFLTYNLKNQNKILKFNSSLPEFDNLKNYLIHIFQFFSDDNLFDAIEKLNLYFGIQEKLQAMAVSSQNLYQRKIIEQCFDKTNELISQIKKTDETISLKNFYETLKSAAKEIEIAPLPLSLDCVQILDFDNSFSNFDHVFMLNCTKYTAPAYAQDCGILLDKDIAALKTHIKISPAIRHINSLKKFAVYNNFFNFKKSLTITMTLKNSNETSELVKELKQRLYITAARNKEIRILPISVNDFSYYEQFSPLSVWDFEEYKQKFSDSNILDGNITNLSALVFNHNCVSATQLELYFRCPFCHFLNYAIKPKFRQTYQLKALDIGNLFHILAQRYYQNFKKNQTDTIDNFCEQTVRTYLKDWHNNIQNKELIANLIKECRRFLNFLSYLDENSNFRPEYFEYKINDKLNLPDGLTLTGKIDRIDLSDEGFRIIDYKSGKADATLSELYYGQKLQLFLYANAAAKVLNKRCMGVFYLPIKNEFTDSEKSSVNPYRLDGFYNYYSSNISDMDRRLNGTDFFNSDIARINVVKSKNAVLTPHAKNKFLTDDEFNKFLNYSLQLCANAVKEIKSGVIAASAFEDAGKSECDYCPYLQLCRKNSRGMHSRQKEITVQKNVSFGGSNE